MIRFLIILSFTLFIILCISLYRHESIIKIFDSGKTKEIQNQSKELINKENLNTTSNFESKPLQKNDNDKAKNTEANLSNNNNGEIQENIEWQVGPFSALYLNMGINEMPTDVDKHFHPTDLFPDNIDRTITCIDPKHIYINIPINYDFNIFNISTKNQELLFVSDFDWDICTTSEKIESSMINAVPKLKLNYIKIIPNNNNIKSCLENYFRVFPKVKRSPKITFYLLNNKEVVPYYFQYITYSWNDKNNIYEYHELYEQDKSASSYIIITKNNTENYIVSSLKSMKNLLTSEKLSEFMEEFKRRNWQIGYGIVRENLGIPWEGINNPRNWDYWPSNLSVNKQNLVYLLMINDAFRVISLHFDDKGMLDKIEIIPPPKLILKNIANFEKSFEEAKILRQEGKLLAAFHKALEVEEQNYDEESKQNAINLQCLIVEDRIKDIDAGIIIDKGTGLMWQKYSSFKKETYKDAEKYCSNIMFGGYTDWRIPTAEEFKEFDLLIKYKYFNNLINPNSINDNYFISTQFGYGNYYNLSNHKIKTIENQDNVCVRAVRNIQNSDNPIKNIPLGEMICITCDGTGKCDRCKGQGSWIERVSRPYEMCYYCDGIGKVATVYKGSNKCPICAGTGKLIRIGSDLYPYIEKYKYSEIKHDCPKCGGSGKCSTCQGTGKAVR